MNSKGPYVCHHKHCIVIYLSKPIGCPLCLADKEIDETHASVKRLKLENEELMGRPYSDYHKAATGIIRKQREKIDKLQAKLNHPKRHHSNCWSVVWPGKECDCEAYDARHRDPRD